MGMASRLSRWSFGDWQLDLHTIGKVHMWRINR